MNRLTVPEPGAWRIVSPASPVTNWGLPPTRLRGRSTSPPRWDRAASGAEGAVEILQVGEAQDDAWEQAEHQGAESADAERRHAAPWAA